MHIGSHGVTKFGQLCQSLRTPLHMTKYELAKKIGVQPIDISKYESGERIPPQSYIESIAELFNHDITSLYAALNADIDYTDKEMTESRIGE